MLNKFNEYPEYSKNVSSQLISQLDIKNSVNLISLLDTNFKLSLNSEAENCPRFSYGKIKSVNWWGVRYYYDNCAVNQMKRYLGHGSWIVGLGSVTACTI